MITPYEEELLEKLERFGGFCRNCLARFKDIITKPEAKLCCGGLGLMGKCGRGTKKGCTGAHCRCMQKDCANMHYVDCFEHYIHVEHVVSAKAQK